MSELYEKIYAAVQKIPRGKVATYAAKNASGEEDIEYLLTIIKNMLG